MYRIGIATWTLDGDSLDSKLRMIADMGYNAASVLGRFLDDISSSDLAAVERTVEERDLLLTVHSNFQGPDKTPDEAKTVTQAERILAWHAKTGRVACLSYDAPWKETRTGCYRIDPASVLGVFEKILSLSAGCGVRVALEDSPLDAEEYEPFAGWADRFPHWGILVDLGHMNMRLREPKHDPQPLAPGAVDAYLRRIPVTMIEVHIHSNDGTDDQHAPPYMGNSDTAAAARTLSDIGFDGISTIEIVPAWCGLQPDEVGDAVHRSFIYWSELLDKRRT